MARERSRRRWWGDGAENGERGSVAVVGVSQEEFHRFSGYWWSPDGSGRILAVEVDESAVETYSIQLPAGMVASNKPDDTPQRSEEHRYPRAGTLEPHLRSCARPNLTPVHSRVDQAAATPRATSCSSSFKPTRSSRSVRRALQLVCCRRSHRRGERVRIHSFRMRPS